jgi:ribulose-5-phosphate 4-epimerase/fuculose-1-phosphate aldolase
MPEQPSLRSELAAATRILASHRLIGMFGHVSVLTEDPQRYLVCPGAGARKDRCRSADVLELDLDHEFEPGLPLELYMHSEVHRLKPHIKSLIHVHSPALVALAAMAKVPTDLLMLYASFWPGAMPVWDEPDLVRDRAAAQRLIGILGDQAIALLRWHGIGEEAPLGEVRVRASAAQAERLVAWAAAWPERTWAVEGAGAWATCLPSSWWPRASWCSMCSPGWVPGSGCWRPGRRTERPQRRPVGGHRGAALGGPAPGGSGEPRGGAQGMVQASP